MLLFQEVITDMQLLQLCISRIFILDAGLAQIYIYKKTWPHNDFFPAYLR